MNTLVTYLKKLWGKLQNTEKKATKPISLPVKFIGEVEDKTQKEPVIS